jgi:hypothetical protein
MLATLPTVGHALGLGRIQGDAILGETLQVEVALTGASDKSIDDDCLSIQRPADAIDADYFPRDMVAHVDRQGGGLRIRLATRSAVRQPVVEFRLTVTCGYNLSHDYLLMASPRSAPPPAAPAVASVAAPRTVPLPPASTPAPAVAAGVALPDGIAGRNVTLERDMTLEQVARQHFPGPLRQGRFMRWVIEANPQLFAGVGNARQHTLPGGQQLLIPDGVPPRRPGDYQQRTPTPTPTEAPSAGAERQPMPAGHKAKAAPATPGPAAKNGGDNDRLVVGGSGGTARDFKDTMALVDRLTGMLQQQVSTQAANDEKIQKLEAAVAELGQTIVKLESEARQRDTALRSALQAATQARQDETAHGWWQLLLAIVAGGLAGVGAMKAYGAFARRRADTEADAALDGFDLAPPATAAPQPSMTDFDPGVAVATPTRRPTPPAVGEIRRAPAAGTNDDPAPPNDERPAAHDQGIDFEPPAFVAPVQATAATAEARPAGDSNDPATAALELANIMTSMGLTESAAQTLVEHIRVNPRQSLLHWLKLLELHRLNGNRAEFERSANEMREHFNVQADEWTQGEGAVGRGSLETYPHVRAQIVKLWRKADCLPFLQSLLIDNRDGTRAGFPLVVAEEILLLIAILSGDR